MSPSTTRGGTPRNARRPSSGAASGSSRRPAGAAGQPRRPAGSARRTSRSDDPGRERLRPATVRRLAGLAAIVVLLAIMLVPTVRRYLAQRDEIAGLKQSIVEQQRQVGDLAQQRARWDDQAYVEQQIRARLHFVKPGETSYTILEPQSKAPTSSDAKVVGVDLDAQELPWYGQVWTSLSTADQLGAEPTSAPSTPTSPGATPSPATSLSGVTPSASPGATPGQAPVPGASPTGSGTATRAPGTTSPTR